MKKDSLTALFKEVLGLLYEMLNKFHKDGKILYEEKTSEIMMVNWFKYNVVCKSCKTRKYVNKELQGIKSTTLWVCKALKVAFKIE